MANASLDLNADERAFLALNGYVVRRNVFAAAEVAEIAQACEQLVDSLVKDRQARRYKVGAYVFDMDAAHETMIKWEGDTDVVHGIEPCAHLSPVLQRWALDPRFIAPMRAFVNSDTPELFTEKLNLKRPRHGGVNPLHQDLPYWVGVAGDPANTATAMLMLDDAVLANGCLQVVPGSHTQGQWTTHRDPADPFRENEIDTRAYPDVRTVPVELSAGSMVMFGACLVHQSAPNTSDLPRRAMLFSYQPPGHPHMREVSRRAREERAARRAREREARSARDA